jgi:diguanylate cyclase (GGDEF)-like protein
MNVAAVGEPAAGFFEPPDLAQELERLTAVLYQLPVGVMRCGADGMVELMNPPIASIFAHAMAAWTSGDAFDLLSDCFPDLREVMASYPGPGPVFENRRVPLSSPLPGSEPAWLAVSAHKLEAGSFSLVIQDVTAEVARERRMRQAGAWIAALVQGDSEYMTCRLDASGRVACWSDGAGRLTGHGQGGEARGLPAAALFAPDVPPTATAAADAPDAAANAAADAAIGAARFAGRLRRARRSGWDLDEGWMRRADGSVFYASSLVAAIDGAEGDQPAFALVARDMTHRREAAEALRRLTVYDYLTGCYNRAHLFTAGEEELALVRASRRPASLILFDADRFKSINDRFGHDAGDAVLRQLALVCQRQLREGDLLARLGGEEFCALLPGCGLAEATRVAERMRGAIAEAPVRHEGEVIAVTASFGVVEAPGADAAPTTLARLVRAADEAMYAAKRAGRNRVETASV